MGTPAAGGQAGRQAAFIGFPLSKSKSFQQVFIKLSEYVDGHNISTELYITSQIPPGTSKLWPLNCPKLGFFTL